MYNTLLLPVPRLETPKSPSYVLGDWRFGVGSGSKAFDYSRHVNHGDITDATWTTGKVGKALSFNGSSAYVEIADHARYKLQKFSISLWFYLTALQWGALWCDGFPETSNYGITIRIRNASANPIGVTVGDGTGTSEIAAAMTVPLSQWNHFVFTFNAKAGTWQLNGETPVTGTFTKDIVYDTAVQRIGARGDDDNFFSGKIDQVRHLGVILSENEGKARYLYPG